MTEQSEEDSKSINIKVASQDGNEIFFKLSKTTPLSKLMTAYCSRQGVEITSIRFLFDGQRIMQENTPNDLDMENEDVIDAVLQQTGGWKK